MLSPNMSKLANVAMFGFQLFFFLQSVSLAWSLMPNALTSGFVFFFFLDALLSSWM